MTKRDFFILVIKLFGLWSGVKTVFSLSLFSRERLDIFDLLAVIVALGIVGGLFWLLTFKASNIVDFLRLANGFSEDRIELGNIKSADIIKIGTFVIGGLMIVENVPAFLSHTLWAFKGSIAGLEFGSREKLSLTKSGLNILFGYWLATNYNLISKLLKEKDSSSL